MPTVASSESVPAILWWALGVMCSFFSEATACKSILILQALYFCLGSDTRAKSNAALRLLGALARHSAQSARDLAQALDWSLGALQRLAAVPKCAAVTFWRAHTS